MEQRQGENKSTEDVQENKGLLSDSLMAAFFALVYHSAIRAALTAQKPISDGDVIGAMLGFVLLIAISVILFRESNKEHRGSTIFVAIISVAAAYGAAYSIPADIETVATVAIVGSIIAAILAAANAGRTGNATLQALGIYTIEVVVSFMPIFLFLRIFKM